MPRQQQTLIDIYRTTLLRPANRPPARLITYTNLTSFQPASPRQFQIIAAAWFQMPRAIYVLMINQFFY